ncbi:MAG: chemotaxis protein CheD [Rubrivivax sp.]|nr:MAG: chemotaxis protein CheD [Rubrivivax sp.]
MSSPSCEPEVNVFLKPGDYFVGDERHRVRTLLGSCVSVTLWHPQRRIGAMSHFLLAHRPKNAQQALDPRYGNDSLALMLRALAKLGVPQAECESKVFGGGDMFPEHHLEDGSSGHVGRRNGEAARQLLQAQGIRIHAEDLFGIGHRKILFDVRSGSVWTHQVKPEKRCA